MKRILITGGTGCIGSATIYKLLKYQDVEKIVVATRSGNVKPVQLWLGDDLDPRIEFVTLDVSEHDAVKRLVPEINPTHIIHLGGVQSPDCSADHLKGMEINVGGTMVLLDVAETLPNLERFVFASSGAVYGERMHYLNQLIPEDVQLIPPNNYGIWKLAGEHLARLFHEKTKVPTVCLRLNTTYGPGRDKGLTSATTTAMKTVALGAFKKEMIPFAMPYYGYENYHYVEDVGEHFAACAMQAFDGYGVFNIKGETMNVGVFLQLIRYKARVLGLHEYTDVYISSNAKNSIFSYDLSYKRIDAAFPNLPLTDIEEGIHKSLVIFSRLAKEGKLTL
jgi:nucleoside-diphosphate-sugar epimerase